MASTIQIKRSSTTATPSSLNPGELAFSNVTGGSGVLYIGSTDGVSVVPIGGLRNPGILTANQALVTNSTSYIDNVKAANLVASAGLSLSTYVINTVSNFANLTVLGANTSGGGSNTELATTAAIVTYVAAKSGAAVGSNGQFLFNNSGITTGANNFYYDYTSGALTVGNSSVNVQIGYVAGGGLQMQHWHGNANTYEQVQITNANTGPSASGDYIINADDYTDTTNYVDLGINGSGWSNTGWTINGPNDGYLYAANGTMAIGTASPKPVQFFSNGTLSTNEAMRIDAGANVGIGNTNPNAKLQVTGTANVSANVTLGQVLTVQGNTFLNGNVTFGSAAGIIANGSIGLAGQTLVSNGSSVYWGTGTTGSNTQVQFNDSGVANASAAFTFNKASNTLTTANLTVTSYIVGNANFSSNIVTTGTVVNAASATIYGLNGVFTGNLTVGGTVTTINTQQFLVTDPIIELGANNGVVTSDAVDVGWFTVANTGGTINYPSFGRIAGSSTATNPYFKFFTQTTNPNTATTFTPTSTGFVEAYLVPYGQGGAFVANSSNVQITANGTFGVNFAANSLTLTTPLAATSGGTGQNTYSTGDLLYASSSTALSKLSVPGSAANGQVLQIVNNLPAYGTLDGGTF